MSGTTMPSVVDLLITRWNALLTGGTFPAGTFIADGYPGPDIPTVMVAVGGTPEPTAEGTQTWAYLGAKTKEENYKVQAVVSVGFGGDGEQAEVTGADAQQAARNLAYTVGHAIESDLIADPTLGQFFNTPPVKGGWAGIEDMALMQTDEDSAAMGVLAEMRITIAVKALI